MEELGIEADICVGASAGAIAGAFYAEGYTPAQMIDWFRPFWQRGLEAPPLKARYFLGLPNQEQRRSWGYLTSLVVHPLVSQYTRDFGILEGAIAPLQ